MSAKQWQCGTCGVWVSDAWGRHVHMGMTEQVHSLDAMRALRAAEEAGISHSVDACAETVHLNTYYRTFKEPTREMPHGQTL